VTIPAKVVTKRDKAFDSGMFTEEKFRYRETYSVPVKSAANVIAVASSRVRPMDLCERANLDSRLLDDPGGRIPLRRLVMLYETAARLTREQAFGLRVAAKTELRAFDVMGYIVTNSATLEDALNNAVRYFPLWTDGAAFRTESDRSALRFILEYSDPGIAECRHDCEMTLLMASKIGRLPGRCHIGLREVHFQHSAPNDTSEHRRLFGTSVCFRMPTNQLIFDKAALGFSVNHADHGLCDVLIRYAKDLLANTGPRLSLADRTHMALRRSLLSGDAQLTTVARNIGMGARTLQRQLRAQGTSFRELLGKLRRELAEQYLQDSEMNLSEIAYLLCYAQPSEFHRAFRTWMGTTPKRYRRVVTSC
jgi:AraC-like DNA-binding protein